MKINNISQYTMMLQPDFQSIEDPKETVEGVAYLLADSQGRYGVAIEQRTNVIEMRMISTFWEVANKFFEDLPLKYPEQDEDWHPGEPPRRPNPMWR